MLASGIPATAYFGRQYLLFPKRPKPAILRPVTRHTTATTASVVSFLAKGCAVGGAINAFALGAGVPSVRGNNDKRPLTLQAPQSTIKLLVDPANGEDGLRIRRLIIPSPTANQTRFWW